MSTYELQPDGTLRDVDDPPTRADLVQVVRCRDCKHCMSYWKSDYCDYFSHVTNDPDGFCAWGERRESE